MEFRLLHLIPVEVEVDMEISNGVCDRRLVTSVGDIEPWLSEEDIEEDEPIMAARKAGGMDGSQPATDSQAATELFEKILEQHEEEP